MSCCIPPVAIAAIPNTSYQASGYCPVFVDGVWNAEVEPLVYASNGVIVQLSPNAIAQIKAQYTGEPLLVKFGATCGGCCQCQQPKRQACCADIHFLIDAAIAHRILFGKKNREASLPTICTNICVGPALSCLDCSMNTIMIKSDDAAVVFPQLNGNVTVEPMKR